MMYEDEGMNSVSPATKIHIISNIQTENPIQIIQIINETQWDASVCGSN